MNSSTKAQQKRLLEYLQKHKCITTLQARSELDILHPAARIQELRALDHNIFTQWQIDYNNGSAHRVARYVLLPGVCVKRVA